ncbi:hypothetical protein [Malaciobacter marinus]|uniref:hypothetical protein n=1 Tax=Malaciobacter marinus TaxID=505249 RepID=UPI003AFFAB39
MNRRIMKNMTLKERFASRGFSPMAYAKAYAGSKDKKEIEKSRVILSSILKGSSTGTKKSHGNGTGTNGITRKLIAQLKKDRVWIGPLPWEE